MVMVMMVMMMMMMMMMVMVMVMMSFVTGMDYENITASQAQCMSQSYRAGQTYKYW
jgi:hypothetical protein